MKLRILGTGNAGVTECYNTCFALTEGGESFLVDAGGGNTILRNLKLAGIPLSRVRNIFVTHKHVDHIMGVIWLVRLIGTGMERGSIEPGVNIYAHDEVIGLIDDICRMLLQPKQYKVLGDGIRLIEVKDGDRAELLGCPVAFFDIGSTKAKQFGFAMELPGGRLCCCGDEPYKPVEEAYARGSKWLLHEAFCLHSQAEEFKPYEKHHSTVKDAAELAAELGVENLLLYHTEDKNIKKRKELYTAEAREFFSGNIFVPDDMEEIEL